MKSKKKKKSVYLGVYQLDQCLKCLLDMTILSMPTATTLIIFHLNCCSIFTNWSQSLLIPIKSVSYQMVNHLEALHINCPAALQGVIKSKPFMLTSKALQIKVLLTQQFTSPHPLLCLHTPFSSNQTSFSLLFDHSMTISTSGHFPNYATPLEACFFSSQQSQYHPLFKI